MATLTFDHQVVVVVIYPLPTGRDGEERLVAVGSSVTGELWRLRLSGPHSAKSLDKSFDGRLDRREVIVVRSTRELTRAIADWKDEVYFRGMTIVDKPPIWSSTGMPVCVYPDAEVIALYEEFSSTARDDFRELDSRLGRDRFASSSKELDARLSSDRFTSSSRPMVKRESRDRPASSSRGDNQFVTSARRDGDRFDANLGNNRDRSTSPKELHARLGHQFKSSVGGDRYSSSRKLDARLGSNRSATLSQELDVKLGDYQLASSRVSGPSDVREFERSESKELVAIVNDNGFASSSIYPEGWNDDSFLDSTSPPGKTSSYRQTRLDRFRSPKPRFLFSKSHRSSANSYHRFGQGDAYDEFTNETLGCHSDGPTSDGNWGLGREDSSNSAFFDGYFPTNHGATTGQLTNSSTRDSRRCRKRSKPTENSHPSKSQIIKKKQNPKNKTQKTDVPLMSAKTPTTSAAVTKNDANANKIKSRNSRRRQAQRIRRRAKFEAKSKEGQSETVAKQDPATPDDMTIREEIKTTREQMDDGRKRRVRELCLALFEEEEKKKKNEKEMREEDGETWKL